MNASSYHAVDCDVVNTISSDQANYAKSTRHGNQTRRLRLRLLKRQEPNLFRPFCFSLLDSYPNVATRLGKQEVQSRLRFDINNAASSTTFPGNLSSPFLRSSATTTMSVIMRRLTIWRLPMSILVVIWRSNPNERRLSCVLYKSGVIIIFNKPLF